MKLLVVEDESKMLELLSRGLSEAGFEVDVASDGAAGLQMALTNSYNLMVLDVMLPFIDGFEVCRQIRKQGKTTSILMLTAKYEIDSRILGLDSGADDYMVKPFSFAELLARLRALVRRGTQNWPRYIEKNGVRIDVLNRKVSYSSTDVVLTATEFDLFKCLFEKSDAAISRARILEEVWEFPFNGSSNIVDQYVGYLRKKLSPLSNVVSIETVRTLGYRMVFKPIERGTK